MKVSSDVTQTGGSLEKEKHVVTGGGSSPFAFREFPSEMSSEGLMEARSHCSCVLESVLATHFLPDRIQVLIFMYKALCHFHPQPGFLEKLTVAPGLIICSLSLFLRFVHMSGDLM